MKILEKTASAFMFFTRIPVPAKLVRQQFPLEDIAPYLPFVGLVVGVLSAGIFTLSRLFFPVTVSVIFATVATIVLTGAFHEDGFADVCDAFGGGYTTEEILTIMKDSRVGAFGAIGIFLMLILKIASLAELPDKMIPFALIAAHSLSRLAPVLTVRTHNYVRIDSTKSMVSHKKIGLFSLLFALVISSLPLLLFRDWHFFIILPVVVAVKSLVSAYFAKRIGGYTGDCLGAMQQISEVVVYLSILVLLHFSF